MRSLKEVKIIVDVLRLKPGCYYKMKMTDGDTWLFEFKEYDHYFNGGNCIEIISGESYCVESEHYFYETSGLCQVDEVMEDSMVRIGEKEFNIISGREII
jgi:hypothetical protein